ncbi:MAG: P1 family peptidase, partial [Desulfitobacterium hafniense]|nr:P1 family peptidase [Desulfitobacterium hafniense]
APLTSRQLYLLAKRAFLGLARTRALSRTGSGDFCLFVSTSPLQESRNISDWELDSFYPAVVEAAAESVWNSLFLAETIEGRDGHIRLALPIEESMNIIETWSRRSK